MSPRKQPATVPAPLKVRGVCSECGKKAFHSFATKCDEHREHEADRQPRPSKDTAGIPVMPTGSGDPAITAGLTMFYQMAAQIWAFRDPQCAGVLAKSAPAMARSWAVAAESNEHLKSGLLKLTAGESAYVVVAIAHLPVIAAVMGHHVVPAVQGRRDAKAQAEEIDRLVAMGAWVDDSGVLHMPTEADEAPDTETPVPSGAYGPTPNGTQPAEPASDPASAVV